MTKTTNYKNVSWSQKERKWRGCVTVKGVKHIAGSYDDEIECVKAVDKMIIRKGLPISKLQILKPIKNEK